MMGTTCCRYDLTNVSILITRPDHPFNQSGKEVDSGSDSKETLPIGKYVIFFIVIEIPSPQWDIGSDSVEGLNPAKWGYLLLFEV